MSFFTVERKVVVCLSLLAAVITCCSLSAQTVHGGTVYAEAHNRYGPDPQPMTPEPLVAPIFLQTDQIDSAVTVVNGLLQATPGTLTVRDLAGNIVAKKQVTYPPHSSTVVQIRDVLAASGSAIHTGSVILSQDPSLKAPALLAQLSLTMHVGSQSAFLEEEFGMPGPMMGSATLQGIASQTSTSEIAQTVYTKCIGKSTVESPGFELAAGATVLVQACSWRQLHDSDLSSIAALTADQQDAARSLGISIRSDGLPGEFYAFGFALNGDALRAQLQPVDFYDPKLAASTQIVYTGVPVGNSDILQPGSYTPVLTLANFSAQPRVATVYHDDSSSVTADTPIKPQVIQQLTLPPGATLTTELKNLPGSGLQHSFTISSDGEPGDVQAHLFSYVASTNQRVEMLAKDAADFHNGGNHPWSIENGNTSTLLLFNPTAQQQEFQVRVSGGGATWLDLVYLAPYKTKAVSINDLVAKQTSDHDHPLLPKSLRNGNDEWSTRMPANGLGRLLVSNPNTGLSRSFSCGETAAMCLASLGPMAQQDLVDSGQAASFYNVSVSVCAENGPGNCGDNGEITGASIAFNTSWHPSGGVLMTSSTNTQVNLQGTSPGSFSYYGMVVSGSCQVPVSGGGVVRIPYASSVVGSTYSGFSSCGNGSATSHTRNVWEQVVDNSKPPVAFTSDGIGVGEKVSATARDDFAWSTGLSTQPGSIPTSYQNAPGASPLHGVFEDSLFNCDTALNRCLNGTGGGLESVLTQTLTYKGVGLPTNNSLVETCTGFTVNGK